MRKKTDGARYNYGWLEAVAGVLAGTLIALAAVMSVQTAMRGGSAGSTYDAVLASPEPTVKQARFADVRGEDVSNELRFIADWVADSGDAGGGPFVIIDKKGAKVYVFDRHANLSGVSPVLLGIAAGDDTVPGVGLRPLSQIQPEERTTPAGRFVGERGHNARGEDVVWVDYDAAVSMHRVLTTSPVQRRLERLASPSTDDNRISYGCINVPIAFYEQFIRPTFAEERAIIYVLPDQKPLNQVFSDAYDVALAHGLNGNNGNRADRVPRHDALVTQSPALLAATD